MTVNAMILPGIPPPVGKHVECRGRSCFGLIRKPSKDDTVEAWHRTLEQGEKKIGQYLRDHNSDVEHGGSCEFHELPPSIHHRYRVYGELQHELDLLKAARYRLL